MPLWCTNHCIQPPFLPRSSLHIFRAMFVLLNPMWLRDIFISNCFYCYLFGGEGCVQVTGFLSAPFQGGQLQRLVQHVIKLWLPRS